MRIPLPPSLCLLVLALLAGGCATAPSPGTGESPRTRRAVEAASLRHEIDVSYASNVFHWLDNLAGATPGKTRDAYVRTWARYHGILGPEERTLLRRWRALRLRPGRPLGPALPRVSPQGCLPPDPGLGRRRLMSIAAMEAESLDALRARLEPYLNEEETRTLGDAIALFEPRLREIWDDAGFLEDFARSLRDALDGAESLDVRARMEAFFGGRFESNEPSRISLMGLFAEDRGTHAEANGRHLLLQIRPSDAPRHQMQVVFHELAHDLFSRMPAERREAWARWFLSRGEAGALAWHYQHEAIPTALGQGVAEARLAPSLWSPRASWYHREPIDTLAKAIYPRLERALFAGEAMSAAIAGDIVAAAQDELASNAPLRAYFATAGLVAPPHLRERLAPLARSLPAYRVWEITHDEGGWEYARRHGCLPLVVITDRLPSPFGEQPALLADFADELDEIGAVALPGTRESGAIALWILARDGEAAEAMAEQLATWPRWPDRPVRLRRR